MMYVNNFESSLCILIFVPPLWAWFCGLDHCTELCRKLHIEKVNNKNVFLVFYICLIVCMCV